MKYQVVIPKSAQKDLDKIPKNYRFQIAVVLHGLKKSPLLGKKLSGEHIGKRSYRVGPYRIIYKFLPKEVILVITIGSRQGVY